MKTSTGILVVVALFAFIASSARAKVEAKSSPMCAGFTNAWGSLPLPIVRLHSHGAALVFEFGIRSFRFRTPQSAYLRLMLACSGKAEILLLSHNWRLAFPRRSA